MSTACSTHGREEKYVQSFGKKLTVGKISQGELDVDESKKKKIITP
jgi:hypothetical protein